MTFFATRKNGISKAVTVNGQQISLPAGSYSLLAGLLLAGVECPFYCAIGQCQRCLVTVDNEPTLACLGDIRAGSEIEIPAIRSSIAPDIV